MSSILLHGRPGGGKSTLAASMANLGYIPWFIDVDNKINKMSNLKPLVDKGKIIVNPIPYKLTESRLTDKAKSSPKRRYPKRMPEGYLWICEQIDELEEDPPENSAQVVPILDGMTSTAQHMKRLIQFHGKTQKLGYDGWDMVLENWTELFDSFFNRLGDIYPHTIVIAHSKDDKDEVLQVIETFLMVDGSFRDKAAGFLDEIYFCYARSSGQRKQFMIKTAPVHHVKVARTGLDLDVDEDVTIDSKGGGFSDLGYSPFNKKGGKK